MRELFDVIDRADGWFIVSCALTLVLILEYITRRFDNADWYRRGLDDADRMWRLSSQTRRSEQEDD